MNEAAVSTTGERSSSICEGEGEGGQKQDAWGLPLCLASQQSQEGSECIPAAIEPDPFSKLKLRAKS